MTMDEICKVYPSVCADKPCQNKCTPINKSSSWWQNRTILERYLLLAMMIIALAFSTTTFYVTLSAYKYKTDSFKKNCNESILLEGKMYLNQLTTDERKKAETAEIASELLKNMNLTANPCEDFYEFSCGGFVKRTSLTQVETVDNFVLVESHLQAQMKRILGQKISHDEPRTLKLVKEFYQSCMKYDSTTRENGLIINDIIEQVGGWPMKHSNWNAENFHWVTFASKLRKIGYWSNNFVKVSIQYDVLNTNKRIVMFQPGTLGLHKEYLEHGQNSPNVQEYFRDMVNVAVYMGADKATAVEQQHEVLIFELKLAQLTAEENNEMSIVTIKRLNTLLPDIPWSQYLISYFGAPARVSPSTTVYVQPLKYMSRLSILLKQTPPKVIANYCVWRFLRHFMPQLAKDIEHPKSKTGSKQLRHAKEFACSREATKYFPMGVGASYIRNHFDNSIKHSMMNIHDNIRAEFIHMLKNVDWMDSATKKHALEKAAAMTSYIAYPQELRDDKKLDEFTSSLQLHKGTYLLNIFNLTAFKLDNEALMIIKPVNKSIWYDHSEVATINAYYIPLQNALEFPAGILQAAFYNKHRPNYMNYGAIGYIIGHEITHGFDTNGRHFDKHGNFANWWGRQAEKLFNEKANCIHNQYNHYHSKLANMNLDGKRTLSENIADIGATKISYNAYKSYLAAHGEEPHMPGMNFNNLQMFWISMGQIWCEKSTPQDAKRTITTSIHSPGEFRVIGSLTNSLDFARDFNCPIGSRMNPLKKCSIW